MQPSLPAPTRPKKSSQNCGRWWRPTRGATLKSSWWPSCCRCQILLPCSTSPRSGSAKCCSRHCWTQLEGLAAKQPVLFLCEDLHWIDPSSRELLHRTIERAASLPVLLIATHRPEFEPPWIGLPQVTTKSLARLDQRAGASMVERIAGNTGLASDLVEEIVARADGVPSLRRRAHQSRARSGRLRDGGREDPAKRAAMIGGGTVGMHAPLMARPDRLGPAPKEVAQIAAAIGREFSYPLLAPVAARSDNDLSVALGRLGEAGLVFARGTPPE